MRIRFAPSTPFLFLALSFALPAAAQVSDGTERPDSLIDPYLIPGVLVEATRTRQDLSRIPQSVSIVGQARIQVAQRQVTIDEALRAVPGVFATNRHNFTLGEGVRLNIRAPLARFGTRGLQLLQDGIPLTMADGTTLPNNLDLGSAGRIEVIRGPSSVLYGNAAGGVISVETELPPLRPLLMEPEVQIGSDGYQRQQLKAKGGTGALGYVVNLNRMESNGFRRYGAAEIRRANLVGRALLSERTALWGIVNLYDMPFAENPSSLTRDDARNDPTSVRDLAFQQGWGKSVTQGQVGVRLEHDLRDGHVIRTLGWSVQRDNWNPIPFEIIALERTAAGVRSEYQAELNVGDWPLEWTLGFDLSYVKDDRRESANEGVPESGGRAIEGAVLIDQVEKVMSVGPFVQATIRPHPDIGLTAGVRYDRYEFEAGDRLLADGDQSGDRQLSAASPSVGIIYAPTPALSLFANYASAYQTPTTVELSNREDGAGGFNEELEAEDLRSFEVGVRGQLSSGRVGYEVAAYMSTVKNGLVRYEGANEQALFRNAGEISRDGVEVALTMTPIPALQARLAYTFQDFQFVRFEDVGQDFSGNDEPGSPPHSLFVGLTHSAPWGLVSAVDVRWVDEYAVNDANTASNWSYTLVDIRAGPEMRIGRATIRPFVGIDNLFDERYNTSAMINAVAERYYEPGPGRTFYLGLSAGAGL